MSDCGIREATGHASVAFADWSHRSVQIDDGRNGLDVEHGIFEPAGASHHSAKITAGDTLGHCNDFTVATTLVGRAKSRQCLNQCPQALCVSRSAAIAGDRGR